MSSHKEPTSVGHMEADVSMATPFLKAKELQMTSAAVVMMAMPCGATHVKSVQRARTAILEKNASFALAASGLREDLRSAKHATMCSMPLTQVTFLTVMCCPATTKLVPLIHSST